MAHDNEMMHYYLAFVTLMRFYCWREQNGKDGSGTTYFSQT